MGIGVFDKLREVETELTISFDGADIVGPGIFFVRSQWIVTVPLHDDDIVLADGSQLLLPIRFAGEISLFGAGHETGLLELYLDLPELAVVLLVG